MSFPSGSTLLVTLQNDASPNTGPFDLYINTISASGILIANDISKSTLLSPGYSFMTPIETYKVIAKSDGSITTLTSSILNQIPGFNKTIKVTGSYSTSLTPGTVTASVFLDNGYGLQKAGTIPDSLNVCPALIGIGTGSINGIYNTLVVLKENETGSNYIKFFVNSSATSNYFYHIPSISSIGSGSGPHTISTCVDLSGGGYQTVNTSSIDLYPTASVTISMFHVNNGNTNAWNILKVNGTTIYSSSINIPSLIPVPGNAFVELTASALIQNGDTGSYSSSLSNNYILTYPPNYNNSNLISYSSSAILTTSSISNSLNYAFYAVPGGQYFLPTTSSISLIPSSFDYYLAQQYECGGRTYIGDQVVAFESGTSVNYSRFYNDVNATGFTYRPFQTNAASSAIELGPTSYLSSLLACNAQ